MPTSAQRIWEAALGELELEIARPSYEALLKGTVGVSLGDDKLVVGTPNPFIAELLEKRMSSLIQRTVSRLTDQATRVSFQVSSGTVEEIEGDSERACNNQSTNGFKHIPLEGHGRERSPFNPRYTFSSFVIGKSNQLSQAAAWAVANQPGKSYNPLFIYAGVGLGKTHLLHAVGHHMLLKGLNVAYVTTEQFTNEFIKAIREGKSEEFRTKYRSCDALLIDDIQFIIGKEQTQEGFFHTFNELHNANRQIVITSDRLPKALPLLDERLRSRFQWGLITDMHLPELETRLAILRAKASGSGTEVPEEVLNFIGTRVYESVRDMEGSLNRIVAFAEFTRQPITLELAKGFLADHSSEERRPPSPDAVIQGVAQFYKLDAHLIKTAHHASVNTNIGLARQVAMFLLRDLTSLPFAQISKLLGAKSHSTVLRAYSIIYQRCEQEPHFRAELACIRSQIL